MKLLRALPQIADCELLFPNTKGTVLSDMTLTAVLRRMGCPVTAHGLAHQLKDKAEAAYARGTLFGKRRSLMAD